MAMRTKARSGYHHGDLESALLAEARALVAKRGVEQISLREIASNVGVSPSAAYHHFPDKNALLNAVASFVFDELGEEMQKAVAMHPGKTLTASRRRFRATGESYVRFARRNRNLFLLCFGPHCDHSQNSKEDTIAWNTMVSCLNELSELGFINPKIRPYAEILAWSSIHGISNLVLDEMLPEEAVEPLLDGLELALRAEK